MVKSFHKINLISTIDTYKDIDNILSKWNMFLRNNHQKEIALQFAYDDSLQIGIGNIEYTANRIGTIVLNVPKNLHHEKYKNSKDDYITKENYTNIIVGLFHETRHSKQELDENRLSDMQTRLLAIESAMTKINHVAYEQEYNTTSIDIDAEMFALKQSYVWLCKKFGKEEGENMLLNYIEMRIQEDDRQPRYFGIRNTRDIDNILQQFEDKFQQSLVYKPPFQYQTDFKGIPTDKVDVYFRFFIDNPENQKLYHAENIHSGLDNLKMMFAVTARYYDIGRMLPEGHILKNDPLLTYCERCERGEHPDLNEWENNQQQIADVKEDPYYIESMENPCNEAQIIAVQQDPFLIKYIENPCEEAQLEAIKRNPAVIDDIENPSSKMIEQVKDLQMKQYFKDVLKPKQSIFTNKGKDNRDEI